MIPEEISTFKEKLKKSILHSCQENLSCEGIIKIDALLCISIRDQDQDHEIIVKIHEDVNRTFKNTYEHLKILSPATSMEATVMNGDDVHAHREETVSVNPVSTEIPFGSEDVRNSMSLSSTNAVVDEINQTPNEQSIELNAVNNMSNDYSLEEKQTDVHMTTAKFEYCQDSNLFMKDIDERNMYGSPVPRCLKCNAFYDSVSDLESHNYRVHMTFTCKHCLREFTSRPNMQRHVRRHIGYKPFTCSVCGCCFTRKDDYNVHTLKHSVSKPFVCGICSNLYSDRSSLRSHMKKFHKKRLASLCSYCGKGFGCTMTAERHRLFHCNRKFLKDSPRSLITSGNSTQSPNIIYQCFSCKESFRDFTAYKMHVIKNPSRHLTVWCPLCKTDYKTVDEFTDHVCFRDARDLKIEPVDKIFTFNKNLEASSTEMHYGDEIPKNQYWCTECKVGFKTEENFNYHVLTCHCSGSRSDNMDENARVPLIDLRATAGFRSSNMDSSRSRVSHGVIETKNSANLHFPDEAIDLSSDSKNNPSVPEAKSSEANDLVSDGENSPMDDPVMSFIETYIDNGPRGLSRRGNKYPERSLCSRGNSLCRSMLSNERSNNAQFTSTRYRETSPELSRSYMKEVVADDGFTFSAVSQDSLSEALLVSRSGCNISPIFEDNNNEKGRKQWHVTFRTRQQFSCGFCCERFGEYAKYAEHAMRSHKRFVCDHCGMCFTAKPNRDRHKRYHTGERPYSCSFCPQTFFRGDDLKYHCTTKHPDERSANFD